MLLNANSITDLDKIATQIITFAGSTRIFLFYGEMGAGKTTLIKYLCEHLGTTEPVTSPTFSIVNEYHTTHSGKIYHFDFYRIKSENEAFDIGVEEYFYSGQYCFIEWAEKIPNLIPEQYLEINIQINTNTQRTIAVSVHDGKEKNRI